MMKLLGKLLGILLKLLFWPLLLLYFILFKDNDF